VELALILTLFADDLCRQKQAIIVQQPEVAYQQVYYFVGAPLRQAAVVEKSVKDDPLYQEFLEFKAWKEQQKESPPGGELRGQTPVAAYCGRCHGGSAPKASFFLDGQNTSAESITKALRQIADGSMPPDRELTAQEKGVLMQALLDSEERE